MYVLLVVGNFQMSYSQCVGDPISSHIIPGGDVCFEEINVKAHCDDNNTIFMVTYQTSNCTGEETNFTTQSGTCSGPYQGFYQKFLCESSGMINIERYKIIPIIPIAPPSDVACIPGTSASTIEVSCVVDPTTIDLVSFEIAKLDDPNLWTFLSYTTAIPSNGHVKTMIPNLRPNVDYVIKARSHNKKGSEGYPKAWSKLTDSEAICQTSPPGVKPSTPISINSNSETHWIEVFRHRGKSWTNETFNETRLPDYLSNHNTGDLMGSFFGGTFYDVDKFSPWTRYCVELLSVELPNITSVTYPMGGNPVTSPFANYQSCAAGNCYCIFTGDRTVLSQPLDQVKNMCPGATSSGSPCHCPEMSMSQSLIYTGKGAIALPSMGGWPVASNYPGPIHLPPDAAWFSHPEKGKCAIGSKFGENGCTWQRSPAAYSLSHGYLTSLGVFNNSLLPFSYEWMKLNAKIARQAFTDLGVPNCG